LNGTAPLNGIHAAFLAAPIAFGAEAKEPPREFRLFAAGPVPTITFGSEKEEEYSFTERSQKAVLEHSQKWGVAHSLDWEHRALFAATSGDGRAPAAAWYKLAVRNAELWAVDVEWTPQGAADLTSRAYRYVSPAFDYDPKTREVLAIINTALTNTPKTRNAPALMAALAAQGSQPTEGVPTMLKAALSMMGLPEQTQENEALARLSSLTTFRTAILSTTGKSTEADAIAALTALKADAARVAALTADLEKVKADHAAAEVRGLLEQAEKDGKIAPGSEVRKHLEKLPAEAIRAMLSVMPKVAPAGSVKPPRTTGEAAANSEGVAALSVQQKDAAKRIAALMGGKVEEHEATWEASLTNKGAFDI
jgi:phage I-like protein